MKIRRESFGAAPQKAVIAVRLHCWRKVGRFQTFALSAVPTSRACRVGLRRHMDFSPHSMTLNRSPRCSTLRKKELLSRSGREAANGFSPVTTSIASAHIPKCMSIAHGWPGRRVPVLPVTKKGNGNEPTLRKILRPRRVAPAAYPLPPRLPLLARRVADFMLGNDRDGASRIIRQRICRWPVLLRSPAK